MRWGAVRMLAVRAGGLAKGKGDGGKGRLSCIEMASGGKEARKAGEAKFCKA